MNDEYKLKPKSDAAKDRHKKWLQDAKVRSAMKLQEEHNRSMMKSGAIPYDVVGYNSGNNSPAVKAHEEYEKSTKK